MNIKLLLKQNSSHRILSLFIVVTALLPFAIYANHPELPLFDLRFNIYALLSAVLVVANVFIFFILRTYNLRSEESTWLILYIASITLFGVGEFFQRLSANPELAIFWSHISGVGSAFLPVAILLFAVFYTEPNSKHVSLVILSLMGAAMVSFAFLKGWIWSTDINEVKAYPWGYNTAVADANIVASLWIVGLFIVAIRLLAKFKRTTKNVLLKKQAKLFLLAILLPIVGGSITDLLVPVINDSLVPPMAVFFSVSTAGVLLYGLSRYRVFRLSPSLLALNILATIHESIVVTNTRFEIEFINNEAELLFTSPATMLEGEPLASLFDVTDRAYFQNKIEEYQHTATTKSLDNFSLTGKDGSITHLRISVSKIIDRNEVEGFIFAISDITELKNSEEKLQQEKDSVERKVVERTHELQQVQARLESSINSLNIGFIMTDRNTGEVTLNSAAVRIIFGDKAGLSMSGGTSKKSLEDVLGGFKGTIDLNVYVENTIAKMKPQVLKDVGHEDRILDIFMAPIISFNHKDTEVLGTVILLEDTTEEKVLERSKDEFFSIASHELRTPLTAIRGNSSMLNTYYPKVLEENPDMKLMLDDIYGSSVRLIEIVNDFLDMSRLEQGKMVFKTEAFAIDLIVENIVYEMKTIIKEKGINLNINEKTLDSLPLAWGDPDRTKQILYNMIGNAIKFIDDPKGDIDIDAVKDKAHLKITIKDTGRGISDENRKFLFHKFQQAGDSMLTRDTTRGTGLGLYISKIMSEAMGGAVTLESSKLGAGSTFSFTIPISREKNKTDAINQSEVKRTALPVRINL